MNMKKLALIGILALVVIGCVLAAGCTSTSDQSSSAKEKVVFIDYGYSYDGTEYRLVTDETDKTMTCYITDTYDSGSDDTFETWSSLMATMMFYADYQIDDPSSEYSVLGKDVQFKDEKGNVLSKADFNFSDYTLKKVVCKAPVNGVEKTMRTQDYFNPWITTPVISDNERIIDVESNTDNAKEMDVHIRTNESLKTSYIYINFKTDCKTNEEFINKAKLASIMYLSAPGFNEDEASLVKYLFGEDVQFKDEKGNVISKEDFVFSDYEMSSVFCIGTVNGVQKTKLITQDTLKSWVSDESSSEME